MAKTKQNSLDFEVDKLTNSIENVVTGDSFATEVTLVTKADLKFLSKKDGWDFNWKAEFTASDRTLYKLTILHNPNVIQGVISVTMREDSAYLDLIESAPFNIGRKKVYAGVPGNLIAFVCKLSFEQGFQGYVSFVAKTKLIEHYIKILNATHIGGHRMIIDTVAAQILINRYFLK